MIEIINAVKCCNCGTLLERDSDYYISIYGNICIGENKGIIGNNLSEDGKIERVTIFCRDERCLEDFIKRFK